MRDDELTKSAASRVVLPHEETSCCLEDLESSPQTHGSCELPVLPGQLAGNPVTLTGVTCRRSIHQRSVAGAKPRRWATARMQAH